MSTAALDRACRMRMQGPSAKEAAPDSACGGAPPLPSGCGLGAERCAPGSSMSSVPNAGGSGAAPGMGAAAALLGLQVDREQRLGAGSGIIAGREQVVQQQCGEATRVWSGFLLFEGF